MDNIKIKISLTSKERTFLVKELNKLSWTRVGEKPQGVTNQIHTEVILYKLKCGNGVV